MEFFKVKYQTKNIRHSSISVYALVGLTVLLLASLGTKAQSQQLSTQPNLRKSLQANYNDLGNFGPEGNPIAINTLAEQASFEGQFKSFTPDGKGLVTYSFEDERSRLYNLVGIE
jgi:hypothetical protein